MKPSSLFVFAAFSALSATACGSSDDEGANRCGPKSGTICTVVGTGTAGLAPEDVVATKAELYLPMDMAEGPDARLYVLDWNNHRVRAVDESGRMKTVAGTGKLGDGPEGPALGSAFNHPTQLVFDKLGRMVIAAWHNSKIKRMDPATGMIEDICGTGARAYSGDGGPAEQAVLDLPAAVAFGEDGALFILDQANQVVRRVDPNGIIDRFAGQCIIGVCDAGESPQACPGSDRLSCILDDDPEAGCSQPCATAFAGDGGPALDARLAQPVGQAADPAGRLVFDGEGNLIFADTKNHRIRKIDKAGIISTIAGNGTAGHAGDGGPAVEAELDHPVDVDVGPDGRVYFADTYNSCIRAIETDGTLTTVAGVCGSRGFGGDGKAPTEATLNRPYGIHVTVDGALYIADTYNHRIRVALP